MHTSFATSDTTTLRELQALRVYPSVTLLFNTTSGKQPSEAELTRATQLLADADRRLTEEVSDGTRLEIVSRAHALLHEVGKLAASDSVALFVSPDHASHAQLGKPVKERVIIDDTFATRDLVADAGNTADYRLFTFSEQVARLFLGDRSGLREVKDETWPILRDPDLSDQLWNRTVFKFVEKVETEASLPTVVAGVEQSVRQVFTDNGSTVGVISGNRDRATASVLHGLAWPFVALWLRRKETEALIRLHEADSKLLVARGIDDVWMAANGGRVQLLVVEEGYELSGRVTSGYLEITEDREAPHVVDDVADDLIETVLAKGGRVVVMSDGALSEYGRVAAVLRY